MSETFNLHTDHYSKVLEARKTSKLIIKVGIGIEKTVYPPLEIKPIDLSLSKEVEMFAETLNALRSKINDATRINYVRYGMEK